ncbi:MAG: hypothetical protein K0Q81_1628 [Paenibacillus sp.]|nr:hypothetical protein [Paenibacillus sp.]
MSHVPMVFMFPDSKAASLAYDTLTELGYHAHHNEQKGQSVVQVFVDHSELTSALEITQACGGELTVEEQDMQVEHEHNTRMIEDETAGRNVYNTAYGMDMIPIPAHLVNEDTSTDYSGSASEAVSFSNDGASSGTAKDFDPSGDDYNGFDAGIHM